MSDTDRSNNKSPTNRTSPKDQQKKNPNKFEPIQPLDIVFVRLFWESLDDQITVRVDDDPTYHPLSPYMYSKNILSVELRLSLGDHELVFYQHDHPVYNSCYPKSESGFNYIVVEEFPVITQLDMMKDITGEEALIHQMNYWFGNDNYYKGSDIDKIAKKNKPKTFPMLDSIFSRFNINPSDQDICELLQPSDLIKTNPEKGIRRINRSIPTKFEVQSRKVAIFPLKHTNEAFDIIDLLSNEYTISFFESCFKNGSTRLVLTLTNLSDAVALNSLKTLTFDDRKLIVRFDQTWGERNLARILSGAQTPDLSQNSHVKSPSEFISTEEHEKEKKVTDNNKSTRNRRTPKRKKKNNLKKPKPSQPLDFSLIRLFWQSLDDQITVRVDDDPTHHPLSPYMKNILSVQLRLSLGHHELVFYQHDHPVYNPCYPKSESGFNCIVVEEFPFITQLDMMKDITGEDALIHQIHYWFANDYYYQGSCIDNVARNNKSKGWVPFSELRTFPMLDSIISRFNINPSNEDICELLKSSDLIETDPEKEIRRINTILPTKLEVESWKVAIFPLKHTNEAFDIVNMLSNDYTISSFESCFKKGSLCLVLTLTSRYDAVDLNSLKTLTFDYRKLIVRFDQVWVDKRKPPTIRLFWESLDDQITVRVDDDPTHHPLSIELRLPLGHHELVFYQLDNPVYNPCYPKSESGFNYIVVDKFFDITQLDMMKDITGEDALILQINYWFGNDNYFQGSYIDKIAQKNKPKGWIPFSKLRTFPMLDSIFPRYNINTSNEDICELLQSSDLVETDPKKGIRRINKNIPNIVTVQSRKVAIFPLKHTNEAFDIIDLLSNEYIISSFESCFNNGSVRLVLKLANLFDAVALNSLKTLTFDDRKLIVRFDQGWVEDRLLHLPDEPQSFSQSSNSFGESSNSNEGHKRNKQSILTSDKLPINQKPTKISDTNDPKEHEPLSTGRLFWESLDEQIAVRVDDDPTHHPLSAYNDSKNVLSVQLRLSLGHHELVFYQHDRPVCNPCYPKSDSGFNYIVVEEFPVITQLDLMKDITGEEALIHQINYLFGNDNYFQGSYIDKLTRKNKPKGWVLFSELRTFPMLDSIFSRYNINPSDEDICELLQSSDLVETDPKMGIRRINTILPTALEVVCRKVAIFPLKHTNEAFDIIDLLSNEYAISSFESGFKKGSVRLVLTLTNHSDVVALNSLKTLTFDDRKLIVRFDQASRKNILIRILSGSQTSDLSQNSHVKSLNESNFNEEHQNEETVTRHPDRANDKSTRNPRHSKKRKNSKKPKQSQPPDITLVRFFWESLDEQITVRVDDDPTHHPLSPDKDSKNVLSVQLRLTFGHHELVFYQHDHPVYNPCYLKSESGFNYIVVEEFPVITQLDMMKDITGKEALIHQVNYWFGNDNYYQGSYIDKLARKNQSKGWVPFSELRKFPMLNSVFSRFNINPSDDDICELLQSSDLVETDPRKGIKRINSSIPTKLEVDFRKIAIFPLKHTKEAFDIIDLISNKYAISSFMSSFNKGSVRFVLTLTNHSDAVTLNSLKTLTFNDRKLIVRADKAMSKKKLAQILREKLEDSPKKTPTLRTFTERMLKRTAHQLPILAEYNTIVNRLSSDRFLTVIATAGSGKSSQLPQYLAERFSSEGKVVCTQPRAIAALSLAERIADEYDGTSPGYNVGYYVEGEKVNGDQIMLMTDGQLINKAAKDFLLSDVSVLIIDVFMKDLWIRISFWVLLN
ncbi:hypothetical protein GEMRC1_013678 [Eukaryota sp. GEM-RC1]